MINSRLPIANRLMGPFGLGHFEKAATFELGLSGSGDLDERFGDDKSIDEKF